MKEKKVLVTGSSGFVGKHLVDEFKKRGFEVIPFTRSSGQDVTRPGDFLKLPKVEVIFHLAAIANVPLSWEEPQEVLNVNAGGTANVLEYAKSVGSPVIFAGSYAYGLPQYLPTDENHPTVAENPYAVSKLCAENLCQVYAKRYQIPVTILRFFNIYGPGQSDKMIISQMISELKSKRMITVLDGSPRRDFVFVTDAVDAYIKAMENQKTGFELYNIGSGESFSIREVADKLLELVSVKGEVVDKGEKRPNDIPETKADITKARKELNWSPQVSLAQGLQITLQKA